MAFFALNQRSLCNERCKKVQNEISLKAIDAKEKKFLLCPVHLAGNSLHLQTFPCACMQWLGH